MLARLVPLKKFRVPPRGRYAYHTLRNITVDIQTFVSVQKNLKNIKIQFLTTI